MGWEENWTPLSSNTLSKVAATPHVKPYSKMLKTVFKKGNSCGQRRKSVQVGRKTLGYKASLSRIKWERNECRLRVMIEAR